MSSSTFFDYLASRRTVPSINLSEPAPDDATLSAMLRVAARVPDHGKLAPWRFIVFSKDQGALIGERLEALYIADHPEADAQRLEQERNRFQRAPLVVGVVSAAKGHPKIPIWEQELSAGAVCLNLIHAAHARGFNAQWLTEWYAYHEEASRLLGAQAGERFAGFVHIGTPTITPTDRARPDVEALTTYWAP